MTQLLKKLTGWKSKPENTQRFPEAVGICSALMLLERVLGDLDVSNVIFELFRIVRGEVPCTREALPGVLQKIFAEWGRKQVNAPGAFDVMGTQLIYSTKRGANRQSKQDRAFQCVIKCSQDGQFTTMIWQFSSSTAGRNTISMKTIDGIDWQYDVEMVSEQGQQDPIALAQAGAEIIGELIQRGILGADSQLARANEEHTRMLTELRENKIEAA